ncbi:hypothetical protein ACAF76_017010 [Brevibacillus sp. TJ4]|uniref:hypothetical protein n=1 Tax=Brevibacillus sp. TJ4 TaxID=3234853 RepID=UPI0037D40CCE
MKVRKALGMTSFFAAALVLGAGYGNTEANSSNSQPSYHECKAETTKEKAWSDYVDQEIEAVLLASYQDAFRSFEIDASEFSYYSLHEASKNIKEITSPTHSYLLKKAALEAVVQDIQTGDFMPGLFVHKDGSRAFLTFKQLETGENYIYWLQLNPQRQVSMNAEGEITNVWEVAEAEKKDGKKIEKPKLKSLQDFF